MRGILPAVVAGILSLGLATSSRAQAPTGLEPLGGSYSQERYQYPVVYPQASYGTGPIGFTPTMYPTVYFGGHHPGCYPTWAIPASSMTSKYYGSQRFPWTWRGKWGGDW